MEARAGAVMAIFPGNTPVLRAVLGAIKTPMRTAHPRAALIVAERTGRSDERLVIPLITGF
jgi:hypothetical protein